MPSRPLWRHCNVTAPVNIFRTSSSLIFQSSRIYVLSRKRNWWPSFNTLRRRQNGRHLPDAIFKRIFLYENIWISLTISLKFIPRIPINNIPALFQIMAWRRLGDKPLSEPMVVSLLTHICVTRPRWVSTLLNPVEKLNEGNVSWMINTTAIEDMQQCL